MNIKILGCGGSFGSPLAWGRNGNIDIKNINTPFRALILGKIDNKGNPYDSSENLDIEEGDSLILVTSLRNKETMVRFFQGSD